LIFKLGAPDSLFMLEILFDECTNNNHLLDLRPIDRLPTFATPGELAQLVERLHGMQEVSGSNPLFSTISLWLSSYCNLMEDLHESQF
jgi:hypothetical protein